MSKVIHFEIILEMIKPLKVLSYILVPMVCISLVVTYFGYGHYLKELNDGNNSHDAFRWAFLGGLLFSPFGLVFGLILDLLIWLIANELKTKKVS